MTSRPQKTHRKAQKTIASDVRDELPPTTGDEFSSRYESLSQMDREKRRTIVCDIGALADCPDVLTIDILARLQLVLRPYDIEIVLSGASEELLELLGFTGLEDVLRVEPHRQAEEREERGGVEEERELGDPSV
jgi:hypothetical protein